ncbi:MAG: hypothetical protein LBT79_05370 [Elusimicrobiota bacterium]|jgi:hypothetical protein|nr:hypothetical protein [Elusimicrobiota bacterium]
MKKLIAVAVLFVFAFVLSSCGGGAALKNAPKIAILETMPAGVSTPKWAQNTQDFWEEKGNYFYKGMSEGMANVQASRRAAQAAAFTALAEQVKVTVRNEFSNALESGSYNSTAGGYLKDVFFSVVDNLTISGAVVAESYSQRVSESSETENKLYWRSFVLSKISAEDYKKLVQSAFDKTSKQASANESAKELAKKVEDRFFEVQNAKEQQ